MTTKVVIGSGVERPSHRKILYKPGCLLRVRYLDLDDDDDDHGDDDEGKHDWRIGYAYLVRIDVKAPDELQNTTKCSIKWLYTVEQITKELNDQWGLDPQIEENYGLGPNELIECSRPTETVEYGRVVGIEPNPPLPLLFVQFPEEDGAAAVFKPINRTIKDDAKLSPAAQQYSDFLKVFQCKEKFDLPFGQRFIDYVRRMTSINCGPKDLNKLVDKIMEIIKLYNDYVVVVAPQHKVPTGASCGACGDEKKVTHVIHGTGCEKEFFTCGKCAAVMHHAMSALNLFASHRKEQRQQLESCYELVHQWL